MFWHWYNRFETKTPIPTFEEWEAKKPGHRRGIRVLG
jgi:hypothetical protein